MGVQKVENPWLLLLKRVVLCNLVVYALMRCFNSNNARKIMLAILLPANFTLMSLVSANRTALMILAGDQNNVVYLPSIIPNNSNCSGLPCMYRRLHTIALPHLSRFHSKFE